MLSVATQVAPHRLGRYANRCALVLLPLALSGCSFENGTLKSRIENALKDGGGFKASQITRADRYCIFPTGTVVPLGEAQHLFEGATITTTSG